jgi:beta-phosphoglucomutase-like phosphatase (HAD superfamily)
MRFDLVIFDCDGVLIDSELLALRAAVACLAEYGVAISDDEILERYTGISTAGMVADLETRYGCTLPDFEIRERRHLSALFAAELRAIESVERVLYSRGAADGGRAATLRRHRGQLARYCRGSRCGDDGNRFYRWHALPAGARFEALCRGRHAGGR